MQTVRIALAVVAITGLAMPIAARAQEKKPSGPGHGSHARKSGADDTFHGNKAYCYLDETTLTWRIGNDVVERSVHFDRDAGSLRTLAVKTMGGAPRIDAVSPYEGELTVVPAGSKTPTTLRLDHDWFYTWQSVGTPAHGGRLLTIHLQGIRSNAGYEIEALYEVYPGNRPYLTKSLTLINRTSGPVILQEALYDRWVLAEPFRLSPRGVLPTSTAQTPASTEQPKAFLVSSAQPTVFMADGVAAGTLEDTTHQIGLRAFVAGPQGVVAYQNNAVVEGLKGPIQVLPDGGRAYTPPAVVCPFSGPADTGAALHKRFSTLTTTASP